MPNQHKPIGNTVETLLSRYKETQARLHKIKDPVYIVDSIWGCGFRKHLCHNPYLNNELCSHLKVNNSTIHVQDELYVCRTHATKTYYRVMEGE